MSQVQPQTESIFFGTEPSFTQPSVPKLNFSWFLRYWRQICLQYLLKGTFLQWKTTSGHRRKWKCEDIYLSLILAFFWPMPNSDRPISWAPPTSSSQQTRVHLVVHQPPSPPSKTSWECWCLSFPPPPSPDHPLEVHGGMGPWSSPRCTSVSAALLEAKIFFV